MPLVTLPSGHRVHYEVHGPTNAPAVLLVMGMGFSSRAWDTFPARLTEHFRVITFDNRGTGRSDPPQRLFTMKDLADDAAAVLDEVAVAQASVFGISLGGMITQELVLRHPHRVRSLVLGATFAGYFRSRKPALSVTRHMVLSAASRASQLEQAAHVMISDATFAKDPEGFRRWLARVERAPPRVVLRQIIAAMRHTTETRLARIQAPTLVMTGDADRLVPPENSRVLARLIPTARLVEFAGVGHCFPFERPDETIKEVTSHFNAGQ